MKAVSESTPKEKCRRRETYNRNKSARINDTVHGVSSELRTNRSFGGPGFQVTSRLEEYQQRAKRRMA